MKTNKDDTYYYDGDDKFLRVTKVLEILAKPGLVRWIGSVGNDEAELRRDEGGSIGTEVHRLTHIIDTATDDIIKAEIHQKWDTFADEIKNCLRCHIQAKDYLGYKVKASEKFLVDYVNMYAGTTDREVTIKRQEYFGDWLLDIKTGTIKDPRTKEVYPEIEFQLSAYFMIAWKSNPDLRGCMALRYNKETGIFIPKEDLFVIEEPDLHKPFECWLSLKKVWEYINGRFQSISSHAR